MCATPHPLETRYSDYGRYFRGAYRADGLKAADAMLGPQEFWQQVVYRYYSPHAIQRYLLVADRWSGYLAGTILDVGSRNNALRDLGKNCTLVDKNNPELPAFDWEQERLPFADSSFDTVVCLDTLEHINDLHRSLGDLLRVARRHVIISLPNCWRKAAKEILRGRGAAASYGLPLEPPLDRHKWFFNTEDVEALMRYQAAVAPAPTRVADMLFQMPATLPRHRVLYGLTRRLLPLRYAKNLLVGTVFVCLEKT